MTDKHYEFTGETQETFAGTLHRIRATRDILQHGVRKGDLGGWLGENATLSGKAWVTGYAVVSGFAVVNGNAVVTSNAVATGKALVSGKAWVTDYAVVTGEARVENRQDILTISPIGSESMPATAHPNRDGTHTLSVGCWTGDADGLASEVKKRSEKWQGTEEDHERWRAEYAALEALVRARITAWNKETNND